MESELEKIFSNSADSTQSEQLQRLVIANDFPRLDAALAYVLEGGRYQLSCTKNALINLVEVVRSITDLAASQELGLRVVNALRSHKGCVDDVENQLREHLFQSFLSCQMFREAATSLSGTITDLLNEEQKADLFVKCAECFLLIDENVEAEIYVQKASVIIDKVKYDSSQGSAIIILRFRYAFARVLDANRKFLDAAQRYYELSTPQLGVSIPENEVMDALANAVVCAVLGKSGTQRNRVISLLYKDSRMSEFSKIIHYRSHFDILEKVFKCQIIRRQDFAAFESSLKEHQRALVAGGDTVPEKTLLEHNMMAVGSVYDNIRIADLAGILQVDISKAEKVAAKLITDGVLRATIDQTDGTIQFLSAEPVSDLSEYNRRVLAVCNKIDDCATLASELISKK